MTTRGTEINSRRLGLILKAAIARKTFIQKTPKTYGEHHLIVSWQLTVANGHTLESCGSLPSRDSGNCHCRDQSTVLRNPQGSSHLQVSGQYKWRERSAARLLDDQGDHIFIIDSAFNRNSGPHDNLISTQRMSMPLLKISTL
jgi:hypothetical protein